MRSALKLQIKVRLDFQNFHIQFLTAIIPVLAVSPNEVLAQQCKVISFIQVSKFDEALKFLNKCPELKEQLIFEKAYCQYRMNQPEEALVTIEKSLASDNVPANIKELQAQILYRLERYDDCYDLYRDIVKNTQDDYDDERLTNMSAVTANLTIDGSEREIPEFREDTYELTYNKGCALAGKGKYAEAEKKLRASEKMCREFLEEDGATEEDILEESAIIK